MPLKITDPAKQIGTLNKWADWIEARLHTHDNRILSVAKTAAATGGGGIESVSFTAPPQAIITGSPVLPPSGTINWAWAPEQPGSVFETQGPGLGSLQTTVQTSGKSTLGTLSITGAATSTPATAYLCLHGAGLTPGTPSGWTSVPSTSSGFFFKQLPTSPTASASESFSVDWLAAMWIVTGLPANIQGAGAAGASGTLAFPGNNVLGDALMVTMRTYTLVGQPIPVPAVSDSLGNVYIPIIRQTVNTSGSDILTNWIFIVPSCLAGANTVTYTFNDPLGHSGTITICEIGPLTGSSFIPSFGPLSPLAVPPVSLASVGNGGTVGILPVVSGGSGTSTSTGTAGNIVLSVSPTLTGTTTLPIVNMTGLMNQYNGISTVAGGIPSELAQVNSVSQTANIGLTLLYTTTANAIFRISGSLTLQTVAGTGSTLPNINFQWVDPDNSTIQSMSFVAALPQANTNTTTCSFTHSFAAKTGSQIKYQTGDSLAFVTSGSPSANYSVRFRLEQL